MIQFLLNGDKVTLDQVDPNLSVLDWLRNKEGLSGTKEGCASGDCGACTVTVAEICQDKLRYYSINSCITLLASLHGKQIITVEHLTQENAGELHAVQQAMVDCSGSQCGFCTPGFIMSMYTLHHQHEKYPGKQAVLDALAGNLCRCTGYRPIIDAARMAFELPSVKSIENKSAIAKKLKSIASNEVVNLTHDGKQVFIPQSLSQLLSLLEKYPEARLIAGGTDLMLEITQLLKSIPLLIYIGQVKELLTISGLDNGGLRIGAAVSLSDLETSLDHYCPEAKELFIRFGSRQVRNQGTLGGSLGNASPIGDPAPLFLALNAVVVLTSYQGTRHIPIGEFFTEYRKTVMKPSELIEAIELPPRETTSKDETESSLRVYKISKRYEDDISSVVAAFYWEIHGGRVTIARFGYGGMAAIPLRATNCENALIGQPLDEETIEQACLTLQHDFEPISDARASSQYRMTVAANLLKRAWIETNSTIETRVVQHA